MIKYFIIILAFLSDITFAQSIIDDFDSGSGSLGASPELATEKIERVSASRTIYILSNSNGSFDKGDFISLVIDNNLVIRALVAKTTNVSAGIKLLKTYSEELKGALVPGATVQVIRGDDSYFNKKQKKDDQTVAGAKIQDEDDLYNDTVLEDDLSLEDNSKRLIKTDNVISTSLGMIEGIDAARGTTRYNQLNASWSYQVDDNIWAELTYGQSVVNDFPDLGLDTKISNLEIKAKYTIAAPFFSFVMPYLGYQVISAESPGAGVDDGTGSKNTAGLQEELDLVDLMEKKSIIFGVSVLKRLVPGWFIRGDIGSDRLAVGLALEF